MNTTYDTYMQSEAWQAKRAQRLAIDNHRCRTCGHTGETWPLQVHHITYERLGGEDVENDLITLCSACHEAITNVIRSRRYEGRSYEVRSVSTTITTRQEYTPYGMANVAVQVEFIGSPTHAQRADGKPAEQVGKVDEADFIQARQDRRRL
ncbi:MAG: HNH endonuclease [Desulfurellales bacterium]|nr:MAG: HNH endonuclease [Desulfurellales bacterium]